MTLSLESSRIGRARRHKNLLENGFEITGSRPNNKILIRANKAGLASAAIQLLTLAQDAAPSGSHIHYDQRGSLELGSEEFIVEKK
jgi:hypothetical protein